MPEIDFQAMVADALSLVDTETRWRHQGREPGVGLDCIGFPRWLYIQQLGKLPDALEAEFKAYHRRPDGQKFLATFRAWFDEVPQLERPLLTPSFELRSLATNNEMLLEEINESTKRLTPNQEYVIAPFVMTVRAVELAAQQRMGELNSGNILFVKLDGKSRLLPIPSKTPLPSHKAHNEPGLEFSHGTILTCFTVKRIPLGTRETLMRMGDLLVIKDRGNPQHTAIACDEKHVVEAFASGRNMKIVYWPLDPFREIAGVFRFPMVGDKAEKWRTT